MTGNGERLEKHVLYHATIFGIQQFPSERIYNTSTQKCSYCIFLKKKNNNDTLASRWHGIHFIPPPEGNPKTLTPGPRVRGLPTDRSHGLPLWTPLRTTPKIKFKKTKTEIKIHLLLVHCNRSLVSKFRALRSENVTDLSSVSSYIIDIPHCHFFFAVAISIYERPGNLREVSKFVLLWVHFLRHFVRPVLLRDRELVPGAPAGFTSKWRRERNHKSRRLPGLSCKATATKMTKM